MEMMQARKQALRDCMREYCKTARKHVSKAGKVANSTHGRLIISMACIAAIIGVWSTGIAGIILGASTGLIKDLGIIWTELEDEVIETERESAEGGETS